MKLTLNCKTSDWEPSFWIPDAKDSEHGVWIKIDPDDPDTEDMEKIAEVYKADPELIKAIATCLGDLRDRIEEDLRDLYELIQKTGG